MTFLGWVIVAIVLTLLVVAVAILALPIVFSGEARTGQRPPFQLNARLLSGYAPPIRIVPHKRKSKPERKEKKPRAKSRKPRKAIRSGRGPAMLGALPRLLSDLMGVFHVEDISVDAEFGLGDPADTGALYGALCPILYALPRSERMSITIRPEFGPPHFEAAAAGTIRVRPVALVQPFVRFAWRIWGPVR